SKGTERKMKNIIKKFGTFVVAVGVLFSFAVTSFGSIQELYFSKDNSGKYNFFIEKQDGARDSEGYGNKTIFPNFSEEPFRPGDSKSDKIVLKNNTDKNVVFYVKATFSEDNDSNNKGENIEKLAEYVTLTIGTYSDSSSASAISTYTTTIKNLDPTNNDETRYIKVGELVPNESREVRVNMYLDGPKAGNEIANHELHTKWHFGAKVIEPTDPPNPDPPDPPKPDPPNPDPPDPKPPTITPNENIPSGGGRGDEIELVYIDEFSEEFIIIDDETPLSELPLTGGKTGMVILVAGVGLVASGFWFFIKKENNN
ncbi:MAG: LPXTG cell wall anchor domain-containing protein, partial [Oscillospiraceae bacterium]